MSIVYKKLILITLAMILILTLLLPAANLGVSMASKDCFQPASVLNIDNNSSIAFIPDISVRPLGYTWDG